MIPPAEACSARREPGRGGAMLPVLLLGAVLSCSQAAEAPAPAPPPPPPPAAPAERWPLMKELQGTWPGWLLDGNRMQVTGWTEVSFTPSSDRRENLPMGFNYKA